MIELDTSHAPLMYVRCIGAISKDELDDFLESYEVLLQSEAEHVLLVDFLQANLVRTATKTLVTMSQWTERRAPSLREQCRGCAFVAREREMSETIEMLCEVESIDLETRVFATSANAVAWLRPIFDPGEASPEGEIGLGEASSSPACVGNAERDASSEEDEPRGWSPYGTTDATETPMH